MATFIVGDVWRTECRFEAAGVLTDPTTITLKVRDPAGTETTYTFGGATVSKSATGIYYKDVAVATAGQWVARWIGTGTVPTAVERTIEVAPSKLATP